jgi:hypothetical protein
LLNTCTEVTILASNLNLIGLKASTDYEDVVFTLTSLPDVGEMFFDGTPMGVGATFTLGDIYRNAVTFKHSGLDPADTSFNFSFTSPELSGTGTHDITIRETNNPPWICVLKPLEVIEQEQKKITADHLQLCDIDLDAEGDVYIPPDFEGVFTSTEHGDAIGFQQLFAVDSNQQYRYTLNIRSGSVRIVMRDSASKVFYDSYCLTESTNIKNFVTPPGAYEATLYLEHSCNGDVGTEQAWEIYITKG